ncbi:type VI secretion system protein TssA [Desulfovibrio sp. OttesenSCG-928-G11]|nr:type VI secretion system protein TssA [Desulfovibrio sp. OttesenSCG-928-G11]
MTDSFFTSLGSSPVPGETPAGEDSRYEPEYAAVLEEVEKLSFSGEGAAVSWPAIEKNAVVILSEKSKDLQMAAYLGVALWHNKGIDGVLHGVQVLTGLLDSYWETGWPALKRMRGRVNAIDWWHERTYAFLQDAAAQQIPPLPEERRKEMLDAVAQLDERISTLMPDASPLRDITAAIQRLPMTPTPTGNTPDEDGRQSPPQTEQQTASQNPPPSGAESAPQQVPQISSPPQPRTPTAEAAAPANETANSEPSGDPALLRRHFVEAGLAYLAAARRAAPNNASLWRLARLLIWGGIESAPHAEDGQSLLPAPDSDALARARRKIDSGKALEAALEADDLFRIAPFWLDAQECVHAALTALGPHYAEAARYVRQDAAAFVARLPGVERLAFTDGTPFASAATLLWLRDAAPQNTPDSAARHLDPADEALLEARDRLEQHGLAEALGALDAAKTPSGAFCLRLRLHQLQLLRENGKIEAAQALAEDLLHEAKERDLDSWDPELALKALTAIRDVFLLNAPAYAEELRMMRRRIMRLRPAAALD